MTERKAKLTVEWLSEATGSTTRTVKKRLKEMGYWPLAGHQDQVEEIVEMISSAGGDGASGDLTSARVKLVMAQYEKLNRQNQVEAARLIPVEAICQRDTTLCAAIIDILDGKLVRELPPVVAGLGDVAECRRHLGLVRDQIVRELAALDCWKDNHGTDTEKLEVEPAAD